ncbi:MAG: formate hydrogenase [Leptospiraceae bacterium]|nr:formate hydrogenase [Leptospiraceae bacterium]
MELSTLSFIAGIVFILVLMNLLFAFTKSQEKVKYWVGLIILLFVVVVTSWWTKNLAWQWVLIEATTLFGALLISMSRNEKSIDVAWKFLLLNSFGLSLAFIGIIILSFGIHSQVTTNADDILSHISSHQNRLVETGMWLAIFGYSAKLGLFPNHFWVSDTYAESPSQISSLVSCLFPATIAIALRAFVKMDYQFTDLHFSSSSGLLILGIVTMFYSLWTLNQTNDIRRITAQIAVFHSGALAVFIFLNPPDEIFYYALSSSVTVKALLFSAMGIFRIDAGTRNLKDIDPSLGLNKTSTFLYIFSVAMAFVIPFSPFFVGDLLLIKVGFMAEKFWILLVPLLGLVFFLVAINKLLPLFQVKAREFSAQHQKILRVRLLLTFLLLGVALCVGVYGVYNLSNGGFFNVL